MRNQIISSTNLRTSSSLYISSSEMLKLKFSKLGLDVGVDSFFTAAMGTAKFVAEHNPSSKVYVIGSKFLEDECVKNGLVLTDQQPDYVIIGESESYSDKKLNLACNFIFKGAKLIGTNPDNFDRIENGNILLSCGAWASLIEKATNVNAYFLGKPNPWFMKQSIKSIGLDTSELAMIGDRMDTDIISGIEATIHTVLVLSGVTRMDDITLNKWAWNPFIILNNVGDIAI